MTKDLSLDEIDNALKCSVFRDTGFVHRALHMARRAAQGPSVEELIVKLEEYIAYCQECDKCSAGYLHAHNWKWPQELLDKGQKLREELTRLRDRKE